MSELQPALTRIPILAGRRDKVPCTYILASKRDGVLYVGVTSDLVGRMVAHVDGKFDDFTRKYAISRLVYYEMHPEMPDAIQREKRIKEWNRAWKIRLIHEFNPEWLDLYDRIHGVILDGPGDLERERRS